MKMENESPECGICGLSKAHHPGKTLVSTSYVGAHHYEALECLERHDGKCQGVVEMHAIGSRLKGFPRCDFHIEARLEARENSMEMYADSDTPPSWFDPTYAGETW